MKKNDRHHLIPRSRSEEGFETGAHENIKKTNKRLHERLHSFFGNMTPQEMLDWWRTFHEEILSDEVKDLVMELIVMQTKDFYRKSVLKEIE